MAKGEIRVAIASEMTVNSISGAMGSILIDTMSGANVSTIPINQGQGAVVMAIAQG